MNKNLLFSYHELIRLYTLCRDYKNSNQNIVDKYSSFVSDDPDEMEVFGNLVDISKDNILEMHHILRKINKMLNGGFYNG